MFHSGSEMGSSLSKPTQPQSSQTITVDSLLLRVGELVNCVDQQKVKAWESCSRVAAGISLITHQLNKTTQAQKP